MGCVRGCENWLEEEGGGGMVKERRIGIEVRVQLGGGVFFFQAEDGIRGRLVTGVQTCALPICLGRGTTLWLMKIRLVRFI